MSRRAFFVPHPLESQQKPGSESVSGRVPHEVTGTLIGSEIRNGPFWVMADGFYDPLGQEAPGLVGSSQDPCVFSDPWGPFHSFYRLDGSNAVNEKVVSGTGHIADSLAETVEQGDVIIYGKTTPPSGKAIKDVWVDTVLVVESVEVLPVAEGEKAPFTFALTNGESLPGKGTLAYRYNLSDAAAKGVHETTNRNPHKIIRGRVSTKDDAVDKLDTSFVPLADRTGGVCRTLAVDKGHLGADWAALLAFFEQRVYGRLGGLPRGGWISQFDSFDVAESLLRAVVKRSGGHQGMRGTVAIPPLTPVSAAKRWNPRTARVVPQA